FGQSSNGEKLREKIKECSMIALALFFIVIIGLLSVIVWLLQKYFEMYSSLYTSQSNEIAELQNHLKLKKSEMEILEAEAEINTVINERLAEMEEKFPTEQPQEDQLEMLIINFKKVLHSTLNLLKTEQYEAKP